MGRWWWFRRVLVGSSKTGPAARNSNPRRRHRLRSFASLRMTERSRERPGRRASGFESRIKRDKETRIRRDGGISLDKAMGTNGIREKAGNLTPQGKWNEEDEYPPGGGQESQATQKQRDKEGEKQKISEGGGPG